MFELLLNFQKAAEQFGPIFLIAPGIAAVLAGLFIWLGGLGFTKLLAGLTGAIAGIICGLFIVGRNAPSALFMAAVLAAAAIIFDRPFTIILAAALGTLVIFAVLAWPYLGNPRRLTAATAPTLSTHRTALTARETTKVLKSYMVKLDPEIKQLCSQTPNYRWVVVAAIAVISLAVGFYSWRFASAFSCAILGTMLVFAGMVTLLLYKGSVPISAIFRKGKFYGTVFIAMTVFGTLIQLLLYWCAAKKKKRKKPGEIDQQQEGTEQPWRTI